METNTLSPTIRRRLLSQIDAAEREQAQATYLRNSVDRLRDEINQLQRQAAVYSGREVAHNRSSRNAREQIEREVIELRGELTRLEQLLAEAQGRAHAAYEPVRQLVEHFCAGPAGVIRRPNHRPDLETLRLQVVRSEA